MKIEQKQPNFQPVTITLETQEELDQLFAMVKHCDFNSLGTDISFEIYDKLVDRVVNKYSSSSSVIFD